MCGLIKECEKHELRATIRVDLDLLSAQAKILSHLGQISVPYLELAHFERSSLVSYVSYMCSR